MTTIPKVLHQVWIGPDPIPEQFAEWAIEWARMHPGWGHRVWSAEDLTDGLGGLRNQPLWDAAEDLVPGHAPQFRADLARYEILMHFGGVYLDLDIEPLRPLDPLLDELGDADAFTVWESEGRWANNAVLGARPGHPWIIDLVGGLPEHVAANTGKRPNVLSGPQYLTPRLTLDVVVLPAVTFYPYLWNQVGTRADQPPWPAESYGVHHWNNTRSGKRGRTIAERRRARAMTPEQVARRTGGR